MELNLDKLNEYMKDCTLCPRRCHVNRLAGEKGFCGQGAEIKAARAALHFWEEPCICPREGSGAVFFCGCSLKCVYCQNYDISMGDAGRALSLERLTEIFLELQAKGAANINLVTGGHFLPQICLALKAAKSQGLSVPVVYNSSGYEEVSSLRLLEGLADIFLPDLKYHSPLLSSTYSRAPDYFEKATEAIAEMFRQAGPPVLDPEKGLLKKGVIVRHMLLPGQGGDSKRILRYLHSTYGSDIYISIMNQYTPMPPVLRSSIPELAALKQPVPMSQYQRVLDFADRIGIERGFQQDGGTVSESFIPAFDGEGL